LARFRTIFPQQENTWYQPRSTRHLAIAASQRNLAAEAFSASKAAIRTELPRSQIPVCSAPASDHGGDLLRDDPELPFTASSAAATRVFCLGFRMSRRCARSRLLVG